MVCACLVFTNLPFFVKTKLIKISIDASCFLFMQICDDASRKLFLTLETRKEEPLEPDHDLKPNHKFKLGDLVWGPTKVSSSWPGKIVEIMKDLAVVKWFGSEKNLSKIKIGALQTLSEGFDSHHQARKKART